MGCQRKLFDEGTLARMINNEDPFKPIPAHARFSAPTISAAKPTTVDTIVIIVTLTRHARLAALEGLTTPATLRDGGIHAFAFSSPADARGYEGGGELGGHVVDAERHGAA